MLIDGQHAMKVQIDYFFVVGICVISVVVFGAGNIRI